LILSGEMGYLPPISRFTIQPLSSFSFFSPLISAPPALPFLRHLTPAVETLHDGSYTKILSFVDTRPKGRSAKDSSVFCSGIVASPHLPLSFPRRPQVVAIDLTLAVSGILMRFPFPTYDAGGNHSAFAGGAGLVVHTATVLACDPIPSGFRFRQ